MAPIHVYVIDGMSHLRQSLTTAFSLISALGTDGTMPWSVPLTVFFCIIVIKISIYTLYKGSLSNAFHLQIFTH